VQSTVEPPRSGGAVHHAQRSEWLRLHIIPHEPWLRRRLRRLGVAEDALEDTVQDTYLRLLNAHCVAHVRDCRSYFAQTARSVVLTQVRRTMCVSEEAHEDSFFTQLISPEPPPEMIVESRRSLARVQRVLDRMPERTREVVTLRRIEQLSVRETAERIRNSQSTVEKHLCSAMRELKSALAVTAA